MMDLCSRLYRITTDKTDLYFGRGYKYADNPKKLAVLLAGLKKKGIEVKNVEMKDEWFSGLVMYRTMDDCDLKLTIIDGSKED